MNSFLNPFSKIYPGFFFCFVFLFLSACHHPPKHISRGFYYWKTNFEITSGEKERLEQIQVQKLYTRFFDVIPGTSNDAVPVAKLFIDSTIPASVMIVPVVFITNKTLEQIAADKIETTASNIFTLIDKTASLKKIAYHEIQVDCDWTPGTRIKYFSLLESIRKKTASMKIILSCTIRLHQVKYYRKTGVPPVDRGMLMFYNMGAINDTISNSIFNEADASKYTTSIKNYILPLDLALPVFCWAKHYQDGHITGLLNNTAETSLDSSSLFVRGPAHHYHSARDGFFRGEYFRQGDLLIIEEITALIAKNAAVLLAKNISANNFTVVLYHWDDSNLSRYANKDIEDIYHCFE